MRDLCEDLLLIFELPEIWSTMENAILDAKGLKCPLPVLRARKALKALKPGDILEIIASDPDSPRDFQNFCETTGDTLLKSEESDGLFLFEIQKA